MRVRYQVRPGLEFELEAETPKDIFMSLAQCFEVFGETDCGACGGQDLYFKVRNSTAKKGKNRGKSFIYLEVVCRKCGCYLPIGQHHNDLGTLFPDRKVLDQDGNPVYDVKQRGWRKASFRREEESED